MNFKLLNFLELPQICLQSYESALHISNIFTKLAKNGYDPFLLNIQII